MNKPTGSDIKAFLGSKDYKLSRDFYKALGFTLNFERENIAEFEMGGSKFYLQNFYQHEWCINTMIHITVSDAAAWHNHAAKIIATGSFGEARVTPPKPEQYGSLVTYVWDPSGILLHFAEPR